MREEALELSREILGPEHPHTLIAMLHLAISKKNAGFPAEALRIGEEVLTLSRRVNGPEHFHSLRMVQNLAAFYAAAGQPDEAIRSLEELLPLSRRILGHAHPEPESTAWIDNTRYARWLDAWSKRPE